MAFTLPEALKRATNPMTRLMIKSIATTDELGAVIKVEPVDGTSIKLDREGSLPSTGFIADQHAEAATGGINESTGADDVPEVQFRRIVGDLDIDLLAEGTGGESRDAKRNRLVAKKAKSTWRLMKDKLVNGARVTGHTLSATTASITAMAYGPHLDSTRRGPGSIKYTHTGTTWQFREPGAADYGAPVTVAADATVVLPGWNPSNYIQPSIDVSAAVANFEVLVYFTSSNNEFEGLSEMCSPDLIVPVVGGTGDAFSIAMLDELIDLQKVREERAFLMNGKLVNRYYAALRALGGADPQHMTLPGYAGQVPTYRGIPILTNDNLSAYAIGGTDCADMGLVSLSANDGLVLAAQTGGGSLTPDADPRVRPVLGFRVTSLGELEGKDAERYRVKWYGAPVLKSLLACSMKQGVQV